MPPADNRIAWQCIYCLQTFHGLSGQDNQTAHLPHCDEYQALLQAEHNAAADLDGPQ